MKRLRVVLLVLGCVLLASIPEIGCSGTRRSPRRDRLLGNVLRELTHG
jgi:hypothetical protein